MTDAQLTNLVGDKIRPAMAELAAELLAYRKAVRRLRKAWSPYGPLPGGPVTAAVLDVLAVEER